MSCPCVLHKFWIIVAIWSWEKVTEDKRLLVKYWICVGRVLALFIKEHCFEEKKENELKNSVFFKKLVTNLFLRNSGGIRSIFLLFEKYFNKDQYGLEFLWRLFSLLLIIKFWFSYYNVYNCSWRKFNLLRNEYWFSSFHNFWKLYFWPVKDS